MLTHGSAVQRKRKTNAAQQQLRLVKLAATSLHIDRGPHFSMWCCHAHLGVPGGSYPLGKVCGVAETTILRELKRMVRVRQLSVMRLVTTSSTALFCCATLHHPVVPHIVYSVSRYRLLSNCPIPQQRTHEVITLHTTMDRRLRWHPGLPSSKVHVKNAM